MLKEQMKQTDTLLFDYYLVSSIRENEIFSSFPHYLDHEIHKNMVEAAHILDKLIDRIIRRHSMHHRRYFEIGEFPYQEEILELQIPLMPFFWVRYDAFCRVGGGIFFSEFNYDKPCAQREVLLNEIYRPQSKTHSGFADKFRSGFSALWAAWGRSGKPRIAVLVDPGHFEEVHLAYLYRDLLKGLYDDFVIAGSKNFSVKEDAVLAFGDRVDIILRQYPAEFLHEVHAFEDILKLHNQGKVLILNDPRAILGQAKSLFAYFWELVESQDPFLTEQERDTIRRTIPHTQVFKKEMLPELAAFKDKFVIKPIYGRYSVDVFIGNMHDPEEWEEVLAYVAASSNPFVVQEFCPIKREKTLTFETVGFEEKTAFGNFGIYLVNGDYAGTCVRWSQNYLSEDDMVWTSPIGLREKSLTVVGPDPVTRNDIWNTVNEEAAFEWGYTGGYTGFQETFSLQALILDQEMQRELELATNKACELIEKTVRYVQENHEVLCPVLGISDNLGKLVSQRLTHNLTFLGRFDWVVDEHGKLKLLEFNSETPAGVIESLVLNPMIKEKCGYSHEEPNSKMGDRIRYSFLSILEDYRAFKDIKNIGFVTSNYYEDWYNTRVVFDLVKDLPYDFIMADMTALEAKAGKLWLKGKPLDAVYRFYPLDWLDQDPCFAGVVDALQQGTLSINPPSTLICQSKAFWALVWELSGQGFYNETEEAFIQEYIPRTAMTPGKTGTKDFVAKAYFSREGQEIWFGYSGTRAKTPTDDYVYQERIAIQGVDLERHTTVGSRTDTAYPVVGTYVAGSSYCGIFVRAGGRVTDNWAVYLPAYTRCNSIERT